MSDTDQAPIDLVRIVPSKNMARFYGIAVQPRLFGEVSVIRSWGRIGTCGRSMIVTYEIEDQVGAARSDLEALKRRRGHATG